MATAWLACLAAISLTSITRAADVEYTPALLNGQQQRLAVIVPAYRGDLQRAVYSLERWPAACSPLTQRNVDLVLYYAEGEEDEDLDEATKTISQTAGRCFSRTRTVYANLDEKEDFYPKGPSVQFYKMFLDEDVRSHLAEYDALAIVEWDMLVAADRSFEELYKAAFASGSDFWVKGSNVGGTTFHATAEVQEMWHVLGHINGNAIYNNNDPAFVDYVEYTRARWHYEYPYDVALWLTISDFPYSWPLWQRYSSKFVTTNLISYVGTEHVDSSSVSDAVAGHTLFIHGSSVDDGNLASRKAASELKIKRQGGSATGRKRKRGRKQRKQRRLRHHDDKVTTALKQGCTSACGSDADASELPDGTSTVCDYSCSGGRARFDGFLCGAGNAEKYGPMCRVCFQDEEEARRVQRAFAENDNGALQERVIMCDTMRPPEPVGCSSDCLSKMYTVCDDSCGSGLYGDYDCNFREMGDKCRFCFDDIEAALVADEVAQRHGGRVIMCSTMEPPVQPKEGAVVEVVQDVVALADARQSRKLQRWREEQKWKQIEKWSTIEKFRELEKWRFNLPTIPPTTPKACLDECEHTNSNGLSGRTCSDSCVTGEYGTNDCDARSGIYGFSCRVCYFDVELALANDDVENNERAIMCDTGLPVESIYTRRLVEEGHVSAESIARKLEILKDTASAEVYPVSEKHSVKEPQQLRLRSQDEKATVLEMGCTSACGPNADTAGLPEGTSTVCDHGCGGGRAPSDSFWYMCGAGDPEKYGSRCRLCFQDEEKAIRMQQILSENEDGSNHEEVIMCDTMRPPEPVGCSSNCLIKSYTVCDDSCGSGRYGDYDCNWEGMGDTCRFCFDDVEAAIAADEIAKLDGGRVVMCSTMEPPVQAKEGEVVEVVQNVEALADARQSRKLQRWREEQKWRQIEKWSTIEKFRELEKWRVVLPTIPPTTTKACLDECEHTNSDGRSGRTCSDSCVTGEYGTNDCDARNGIYGFSCRVCYFDVALAQANDDIENNERAILCATGLPVEIYQRRLFHDSESAEDIGHRLEDAKRRPDSAVTVDTVPENVSEIDELFAEMSRRPFAEDLTRGEICAFIAGRDNEVDRWEVTISSILQFVPGVHVVVAVEGDDGMYDRALGSLPGVRVVDTPNAFLAGLYADKYCGVGTRLIYYVEANSIVSRTFTAKDTHSPNGDLLVVYSEPRSRQAHDLATLTNSVLGFQAPSFIHGTDLILPVEANAALRDHVLEASNRDWAGPERIMQLLQDKGDFHDIAAVPQIMAALQYSQKPARVWFFNPQRWVAEHLFKPVSIWEIPLVKPRFACALPGTQNLHDASGVLQKNLDFFSHGGKCESGLIAI